MILAAILPIAATSKGAPFPYDLPLPEVKLPEEFSLVRCFHFKALRSFLAFVAIHFSVVQRKYGSTDCRAVVCAFSFRSFLRLRGGAEELNDERWVLGSSVDHLFFARVTCLS